jgi:hypothetical protein
MDSVACANASRPWKRRAQPVVSQLLIGSVIVSFAVAVAAVFIGIAVRILRRVGPWLAAPPHAYKTMVALICVSHWLLAAITVNVWMWAAAFIGLGLFDTFEAALYFSAVTLTTLGYGDITLPAQWRLLSGICAANGLLLFGLCAAFVFELFARLHQAQSDKT